MNLSQSMDLAGRNLLAVLDPAHDLAPTGGWLVTHDTGRWWDAMLRLEAATGFAIPAELEGAMLRNLERFTANPDGLLLVPPDLGWAAPKFELHSLREGLLAFNALVRFRGSRWARERGHRMLETLQCALQPDGRWDAQQFDYVRRVAPEQPGSGKEDMTGSTGRLIEALAWFFQATGDGLALELAERMARFHLERSTSPDGTLPEALGSTANTGHSHSYLGTLRGLLLYGLLTRQHEVVERIAATYRVAVPRVVRESGYATHDLGKTRFQDKLGNPVPEVACPGDAAQIALWLALQAGRTELLDDVQRWVLCRLLPSQITERDATAERPVQPRELGAYGGVHSYPHGGKNSTIDVTAAVLHTLCDVYTHVAEWTADGLFVHLAFDCEDERLRVAVARGAEVALTVTPRLPANVFLRVPGWAPAESVRVTVGGAPAAPARVGGYLFVPRQDAPGEIVLRYAQPGRTTVERTANGGEYHFAWRGDEIVGICPNDEVRPFYPTMPAPEP